MWVMTAIKEKDSLLWWWTMAAFWEIRVRFYGGCSHFHAGRRAP